MKRLVVCMLIVCLLLGLTGCAGEGGLFKELTEEEFNKWTSSDTPLNQEAAMLGMKNMSKIASSDGLTLYMNKLTTEIAVQTKDGTVWYSNPQNRLDYNKNRLGIYSSQLLVTQIDASETISVVNNFDECTQYGQFQIKKVDNGVEVEYLFGKKVETPLYPQAMTVEKFEEILATIKDSNDQYKFKKYYGVMNLETITDQQTLTAIEEKYVNAKDLGTIRVLKNSPSQIERDNVVKYLTAAGFTEKDRDEQESIVGYVGGDSKTLYYTITVSYTLKDGRLVVDIPTEKITTSSDEIKIQGIEVLPHWNTEDGLSSTNMLIPDGSGAIIEMNKVAASGTSEYKEKFYGQDYAQVQKNGTSSKYNLYFPVYGITNQYGSMYGVITKSQATGYMNVEPCTDINTTPGYGGFYFQLVDIEEVHMDAENDVLTYTPKAVLDPIEVDYTFLPKDKNTWVDVATSYKERLTKENALSDAGVSEKVPMTVEFIGAIDDIKTVVGVPTEYIVPLTTIDQAKELVGKIQEMFPNNSIVYQYSSWSDGGIKSKLQNKVRVESKLGNKSDLKDLYKTIDEAGSKFYPLVDFQYVYRNNLFDGFTTTGTATRGILREASFKADFNISNFMADADGFYGYLVSPSKMGDIEVSFLETYMPMNIPNIGLSYAATDLSSDYNREKFITRNEAEEMMSKIISDASIKHSVLSRGANSYALPSLDVATGVAMTANANPMISYAVPFTQMVLSGTMTYTADSWNLAADSDYYTLQCIETGSAPNFTAIYADNSLVKYTNYDQYYNVTFDTIKESIASVTNTVTDALSDVYGAKMVGYERITDLVVKVSYDNGHAVIVNYGTKDYKTPDGVVKAGSYLKTAA